MLRVTMFIKQKNTFHDDSWDKNVIIHLFVSWGNVQSQVSGWSYCPLWT